MVKNGTKQIICPFLRQDCIVDSCALFNSRFQRCDIGLLAFNLYRFADSIKSLESIMEKPVEPVLGIKGNPKSIGDFVKDTLHG
jgi:hypothetical protein